MFEDTIHRILTGQTMTRRQLRIAGIIALAWISMDVIEFIDVVVRWFL